MEKYKTFVVFAILVCFVSALELPSHFQICKRTDPNINDCLKKAIQDGLLKFEKGLPEEFKLPSVQPIEVESLTIGEGKGAVNVVQHYKNLKIYDFMRAKIEKVNATILSNGFTMGIDAFVPEVKGVADYALDGRILLLPISGKGNATFIIKNAKMHLIIIAEAFEKKSTTYTEGKTIKIHFEPSKIVFDLENLFNGDERLGKEMNNLMTENWKEIWSDVASSYDDFLGTIFGKFCNGIFKKVPYEKLFPL